MSELHTSVHMARSRLGSVTWHGLADSAKGKTRAARAQARRRTRREVTNAVKGCEAAKARGKQEPAKQGAVQKRQRVDLEMSGSQRRYRGVCSGCGYHGPAQSRTAPEYSG
jgi:hypothetical protein